MEGEAVSSEEKAETLADYYERVQWAVRPCSGQPVRPPIEPELPVATGPISMDELLRALRKLKNGRAIGVDGLPAEFWKTVCDADSDVVHWLLDFFSLVWEGKTVPDEWHESRVAPILRRVIWEIAGTTGQFPWYVLPTNCSPSSCWSV